MTAFAVERPSAGADILKPAALVLLCVFVLFLRRPDQFLHPTLWVEDNLILMAYAKHGFWSLFEPIQGYFITSSKLIALTAFKLSFLHAPEIEAALAIAFICFVVCCVALSPTVLPLPWLCAIFLLVVPMEPEVYGPSEYSFWWAGILLVIAALWRCDANYQPLRWAMIAIGGLSSPILLAVAPVMALRAAFDRTKSQMIATGLSFACLLIQTTQMVSTAHLGGAKLSELKYPSLLVRKFIGYFFWADRFPSNISLYVGFVALSVLLGSIWYQRKCLTGQFLLLVMILIGTIGIIVIRSPLTVIHPYLAGQRYFFYPFILLGWIIIWLASTANWQWRSVAGAVMLFSVASYYPYFTRRADALDWRGAVHACEASTTDHYDLPISYSGSAKSAWRAPLTSVQCRNLVKRSLF